MILTLPETQGWDFGSRRLKGPEGNQTHLKAGDKMRRAAKQTRGRRLGGDPVFGALDLDESW